MKNSIIFFDGECVFCNYWVKFIFKRDPTSHFKFAHLQNENSRQYIAQFSKDWMQKDSIVLLLDGHVFTESNAVLEICKRLQGIWPIFYTFRFIPKSFRDKIYRFIARHRYAWFGKHDNCELPSDEIKSRFVEEFNH